MPIAWREPMPAGRKTIHLFAEIWESQFRCHRAHPSLFFIEDFDKWFGKECDFLGFQMDCGYQFADRLEKEKTLHKGCSPANMISHIYNWGVLGFGLFSKWRYFTHWANASLEKDIDWFILVLHQLYKSSASKNL